MKLYSLFFATCLIGFNSFAAVPTVFQLTERSLQIVNSNDIYQLQNPEEAKASLEDPKIMSIDIARYHMLILQEEGKRTDFRGFTENLNKRIDEYNKTYPSQLRQYIESVAQRHKVKIHKDGGTKIYSFQDGVEFFRDLYTFKDIKDPMIKAMVLALMDNPARKETLASPLEKLITNVYQQPLAETFLLSVDEFTETDLQMIATMEKKNSYRYEKVGNLWILGSGFSFLITRDLVEKGNKLTDPKLKSRFEKIIRYHVNFQVPVTQEYKQGAAAYFSPMDGKMTFALPSRGDLDSYTHEMTHSRFTKFTKTLDAWTAAKGYQVPYQIDGPSLGGMAALFASHGGLFNLLNEVNSWRIGESFEGRGADAQILKTLVEGYGPQAGYEATELLEKVWTSEKLAGKSIPYLIYNEIREFNKMTNDQLVMMGFEGVSEENLLKKMNFLIMYRAGRFKGTSSEVDADFVL
ncbi:MAG: hypothetical protein ACXWRU_19900, partial [Pseudobdellovibrionaceae bacterium]